jgi:hypothetical protein
LLSSRRESDPERLSIGAFRQPTCFPGTFTEINDEIALAVRVDRQGTANIPDWPVPSAHVETGIFLIQRKGQRCNTVLAQCGKALRVARVEESIARPTDASPLSADLVLTAGSQSRQAIMQPIITEKATGKVAF